MQESQNSWCLQNKKLRKKIKIIQSSIATTFKDCVIAQKIQELIPLVFPLKIKGEASWLLPPIFLSEGSVLGLLQWSYTVN
jgi:uncharacterized GH25 family protein